MLTDIHFSFKYFIIAWNDSFKMKTCLSYEKVAYPAVLSSGINFHVAAIVGVLKQTIILKEKP